MRKEDTTRSDGIKLKVRESIRIIEKNGEVLIYGGKANFLRITGQRTAILLKILEIFEKNRYESSAWASFKDFMTKEEYEEIINSLIEYNVLEEVVPDSQFTDEFLERYRLQINHFSEFFGSRAKVEFVKEIKNARILVYGAEILGSSILHSLAKSGFGKMAVAPVINKLIKLT